MLFIFSPNSDRFAPRCIVVNRYAVIKTSSEYLLKSEMDAALFVPKTHRYTNRIDPAGK